MIYLKQGLRIALCGLAGGFLSCQAGNRLFASPTSAGRQFEQVNVPAELQTPSERAE